MTEESGAARPSEDESAGASGHPKDTTRPANQAAAKALLVAEALLARLEDASDPDARLEVLLAADGIKALASLQRLDPAQFVRFRDRIRREGWAPLRALDRLVTAHLAEEDRAARGPRVAPDREALPYRARDGRLYLVQLSKEGDETEVALSTFDGEIVEETVLDDGAEARTVYAIEGRAGDRPLPAIEVAAERYAGMSWVGERWGSGAVVLAGRSEHCRVAIQLLSAGVLRRRLYTHGGWRRIDGRDVYLHAGGAIGAGGPVSGVEVRADGALSEYVLPEPSSGADLRRSVEASLSFLHVAPRRLTWPLLASVYLAPLGEVLPLDLSLFVAGPTGSQKSELSAMVQAHYGAGFNAKNLPANWSSTANALERLAFLAKDAVLVVDDFAPAGAPVDVQRLHREADRLLRGAGNRAGRARMHADGRLRPTYFPRGLIVSSGEDVPRGQSLRARTLVLEVEPRSVDLARLTEIQAAAAEGLLAAAVAGYVRWLAGRLDDLRETHPPRRIALRDRARAALGGGHDRTPDIAASLYLGVETLVDFALDSGAVERVRAEELRAEAWQTLLEGARRQAGIQRSEDPVRRFLALLEAVLVTGEAHLAGRDGHAPPDPTRWGWRPEALTGGYSPAGRRVGWVDLDGDLLLEPDAALAAVQGLSSRQGTSLPVTARTLWRRLDEASLVVRDSRDERVLSRATIGGTRRTVLRIKLPEGGDSHSVSDRPNRPNGPSEPADGDFPRDEGLPDWAGRDLEPAQLGRSENGTGPRPAAVDPRNLAVPAASGPVGPIGPVPRTGGTPPRRDFDDDYDRLERAAIQEEGAG